ncbi:hypothetical protein M427DRAFT_112436 [Gonapodya prolifera JEL478]|uniref:RING-type E3 ubiquitin transferase n=1 Tax=Gonapodya prolifera (strain JEL478) TaxID=1344416 RepID=A0A139AD51_GONPJ|nr:hypothetical protein M427DRAFT_112436 [Gonapodya prolifera JEL478]|eukprot:KXS14742.1 hypothetical protein M427DRAFT_112436 [Gonapodya prolifera JEL478]
MADEEDKVRAKRLARLGGPTPGGASSSSSAASDRPLNPQSTDSSKPTLTPLPVLAATPVPQKPTVKAAAVQKPVATPQKTPTTVATPSATTYSPVAQAKKPGLSPKAYVEAFLADQDFEHKLVTGILGVTLTGSALSSDFPVPRFPPTPTPVPQLIDELADNPSSIADPASFKLSSSNFEAALFARLSLPSNALDHSEPLPDYLIACWRRTGEWKRRLTGVTARVDELEKDTGSGSPDERAVLVSAARGLIAEREADLNRFVGLLVNYTGLILGEASEMFSVQESIRSLGPRYVAQHLLIPDAEEAERRVPKGFLADIVKQSDADTVPGLLGPLVQFVSDTMRKRGLVSKGSEWQLPVRALGNLISISEVALQIPKLPTFKSEGIAANLVERETILGPFLAAGSLMPDSDPELSSTYFASPEGTIRTISERSDEGTEDLNDYGGRNPGDVKSAVESLRGIGGSLQSAIFNTIVMPLIKTSPEARDAVLTYIAQSIAANEDRAKMQFDRRVTSTDGFLFGFLRHLHRLAEPFLEPSYSKLSLLDPDYFFRSSRWPKQFVTGITRVVADAREAEERSKELEAKSTGNYKAHFVSEVFHLSLASAQYGVMSAIRSFGGMSRHLGEIRRAIEGLRRGRSGWSERERLTNEVMLRRLATMYDKFLGDRFATSSALLDPNFLLVHLRLLSFTIAHLLRTALVGLGASPTGTDWRLVARGITLKVPTPAGELVLAHLPDPPSVWRCLPEWLVDDVCEFYVFVCRNALPTFEQFQRDEIVTLCMWLLLNPKWVRNPYLKAKLVDVLFHFTQPMYRTADGRGVGRLDDIFSSHPMCREYLVEALTRFYVDVEQTGTHTQFYDKFNIRYNISTILRTVWTDQNHRSRLVALSRDRELGGFVRFVNMLVNDVTFLLDEGISKLVEIRTVQQEMADARTWGAQTEDHRRDREQVLTSAERQASSYMSLANETVNMFARMTGDEHIAAAFAAPELVGRMALMLNHNLATLVGPKCTELKVQNPDRYFFNPKRLLNELVQIYMNLSRRDEFVVAVAQDTRNYKRGYFERAKDILVVRTRMRNENELRPLEEFVLKVDAAVIAGEQEEEDIGDFPEEYRDAILYTLMEDPVQLPSSKAIVDRSTIRTQLLNDPHDPFNRQPLRYEELVPLPDLKKEISEWKAARRRPRDGPVPMDLS